MNILLSKWTAWISNNLDSRFVKLASILMQNCLFELNSSDVTIVSGQLMHSVGPREGDWQHFFWEQDTFYFKQLTICCMKQYSSENEAILVMKYF